MPVMFLGLKAKGEAGKTLMSQMSICILQEENIGSLGLIWYANIQVRRPFFFFLKSFIPGILRLLTMCVYYQCSMAFLTGTAHSLREREHEQDR